MNPRNRPRRLFMPAAILICAVAFLGAATQPETVDLHLEKQPVYTLIERLARQCDAGMVVHFSVQDRILQEATLIAKDVKWADMVKLFESEYHLAVRLVGDRLEVTDADEEFRKRCVMVRYDIRPLLQARNSFPGPELAIPEPGGTGSRLLPPIEPESKPEINTVIDLIQRQLSPKEWQRSAVGLQEYNGDLIVSHLPEMQAQVAGFLADLERAAARQIVCRCHQLPQPPADAGPVLEAKAWQAMVVNLPPPLATFLVLDGQQNHHFSGTMRPYISDTDVNQAAQDPVISVLSSGLSVDVAPIATIGGVVSIVRFTATVDQNWTTADIADGSGQPLATIETPATTMDRARDIRLVPPGGAAIYRFGDRAYALTFEVLDYTAKAK